MSNFNNKEDVRRGKHAFDDGGSSPRSRRIMSRSRLFTNSVEDIKKEKDKSDKLNSPEVVRSDVVEVIEETTSESKGASQYLTEDLFDRDALGEIEGEESEPVHCASYDETIQVKVETISVTSTCPIDMKWTVTELSPLSTVSSTQFSTNCKLDSPEADETHHPLVQSHSSSEFMEFCDGAKLSDLVNNNDIPVKCSHDSGLKPRKVSKSHLNEESTELSRKSRSKDRSSNSSRRHSHDDQSNLQDDSKHPGERLQHSKDRHKHSRESRKHSRESRKPSREGRKSSREGRMRSRESRRHSRDKQRHSCGEQKYLYEDRKHSSNNHKSSPEDERHSHSRKGRSVTPRRENSTMQRHKRQASPENLRDSQTSPSVREKTETGSPARALFKVNVYKPLKVPKSSPYVDDSSDLEESFDSHKCVRNAEKSSLAITAESPKSSSIPLQRMSSSGAFADVAQSSESEEELPDDDRMSSQDQISSSSSLCLKRDSIYSESGDERTLDHNMFRQYQEGHELNNSSYFPNDNPPLSSVSLKPDVPYILPSAFMSHGHNPPMTLFSASYYANTPPPTAPAMMTHGLFQWCHPIQENRTPEILSLSPLLKNPGLFSSPASVERRYQKMQSLHEPPRPNFHGYQLIGDSMLLRFSQQILNESSISSESLRFLGLCVSGQKVGELLKRLRNGFYHIGKKVVVMIGTNDLLKNTNVDQMCQELKKVVEILQADATEIILLTLPPVPRLENFSYHWKRLHHYNQFIRELGKTKGNFSDFHSLFPDLQELANFLVQLKLPSRASSKLTFNHSTNQKVIQNLNSISSQINDSSAMRKLFLKFLLYKKS